MKKQIKKEIPAPLDDKKKKIFVVCSNCKNKVSIYELNVKEMSIYCPHCNKNFDYIFQHEFLKH